MKERYVVQYGLGCNLKHTLYFSTEDAAVGCAIAMRREGYLFADVYDTRAKGEVKLVYDTTNGYCKDYKG